MTDKLAIKWQNFAQALSLTSAQVCLKTIMDFKTQKTRANKIEFLAINK